MDEFDRILSSEDALAPSSGFAARVMDAVGEVASAPPPLAFPWGRFTLAVTATLVCIGSGLWLLQGVDLAPVVTALAGVGPELGYAAITILATVAMVNTRLVIALASGLVRTISRTARPQA